MKLFWGIITLIFCVTLGLICFPILEDSITPTTPLIKTSFISFIPTLINFFLHFLFIYFITLFLYQKISKKNIDYKQLIKLSASISYFKLVLISTILIILKIITFSYQLAPFLNLGQPTYQKINLILQSYSLLGVIAINSVNEVMGGINSLIIPIVLTLIFITILSVFVYLMLKKNNFNKKEALSFTGIIFLINLILPLIFIIFNVFTILLIPIIFGVICYKLISNDKTITNPIKYYVFIIGLILPYYLLMLFTILSIIASSVVY